MIVFELFCVSLCDGKVAIFECGEEKLCLDAQNGNQTHMLWLNRDETLYPGIQTTCTSVRVDVTPTAKRWAKYGRGPFAMRRGTRLVAPVVQESSPTYQTRPKVYNNSFVYLVVTRKTTCGLIGMHGVPLRPPALSLCEEGTN
jgi:hypothetical protein